MPGSYVYACREADTRTPLHACSAVVPSNVVVAELRHGNTYRRHAVWLPQRHASTQSRVDKTTILCEMMVDVGGVVKWINMKQNNNNNTEQMRTKEEMLLMKP